MPVRTCGAALIAIGALVPVPAQAPRPVVGLDHIPVAVGSLEQASATYRALGFVIKPGRYHANGIRNAHVKFPDGSGVELITAQAPVDPLTRRYVEFLAHGDGPVFFALRAPESSRLIAALRSGEYAFSRNGEITTLGHPEFDELFFVRGNRSPTDRPEHIAHANGATALRSIWIATAAAVELERLLVRLGGTSARRHVGAPDPAVATSVSLGRGEVVILPASRQLVAGRPIIGAGFAARDLDLLARQLLAARVPARVDDGPPRRVLVPAGAAHGLWLEFR
jgi:hypothetical protein